MEADEELKIDEELAELLKPSSFSLAECRAKSRAARTKRELKLILDGEKAVMEARAARLRNQSDLANSPGPSGATSQESETSSAATQACMQEWTAVEQARIRKGKKAAHKMQADAALRRSLRDSVASEASFSFRNIANKPLWSQPQAIFKLDFSTLKSCQDRYDQALADSARTSTRSTSLA